MRKGREPGQHRRTVTLREIPFVGRSVELQSLRRVVDPRVVAGHVAVVEAPAGTGKTRVVTEATLALEPTCSVIWTRAQAFDQDLPFGAVDQLRFAIADPSVGRTGDLGGPQLVAEIVEGILRLAADKPVVIVAEDFQWADPGSWRTIRALAAEAASKRLSIIVTIRSPYDGDGRAVLDRLVANGALHLQLKDLSRPEVEQLSVAILGGEPSPDQLAGIERSGGNPLFLTEILWSLQHEGVQDASPAAPADPMGKRSARVGSAGTASVVGSTESVPRVSNQRVVVPSSLRNRCALAPGRARATGASAARHRVAARHKLLG